MKSVAVSEFKARCLRLLEDVRRSGKPVLITKRGKPLAQVTPPPVARRRGSWLGALAGTARFVGDPFAPAAPPEDWEAFRR